MNSLKSSGKVPQIFSNYRNKLAVDRALRRAGEPDAAAWLGIDLAEEVLDRLDFMRLTPERALVTGFAGAQTADQLKARDVATDLILAIDHEKPFGTSRYDLILACASLETVNDLPGALLHIRNGLADGGLFIGQIIGAGSLPSLRQIMLAADGERPAARLHPQIDNRAATGLLERAGFARQVVDSRKLSVRFSSLERLIGDLRDQALTSTLLSPTPYIGRNGYQRAAQAFEGLREDDGKVTETFEILTLTGWR